jgi:hypothetical protein
VPACPACLPFEVPECGRRCCVCSAAASLGRCPAPGVPVSAGGLGFSLLGVPAPVRRLVGACAASEVVASCVRGGEQFRHLHQGDRARVVSC